jgi:hypothetical protein
LKQKVRRHKVNSKLEENIENNENKEEGEFSRPIDHWAGVSPR